MYVLERLLTSARAIFWSWIQMKIGTILIINSRVFHEELWKTALVSHNGKTSICARNQLNENTQENIPTVTPHGDAFPGSHKWVCIKLRPSQIPRGNLQTNVHSSFTPSNCEYFMSSAYRNYLTSDSYTNTAFCAIELHPFQNASSELVRSR